MFTMKRPHLLTLAWTFALSGCLLVSPGKGDGVWMAYTPIQCMGNPWEQDWLAAHDDDWTGYPGNHSGDGLTAGEKEVIVDYYLRKGITIRSITSAAWDGAVCMACSCPAGYTLYVLVSEAQVDAMAGLGFQTSGNPG